jgi:hypothetical protein
MATAPRGVVMRVPYAKQGNAPAMIGTPASCIVARSRREICNDSPVMPWDTPKMSLDPVCAH